MIYTETLLDLKNLQFRRELEALNKSLYSLLLLVMTQTPMAGDVEAQRAPGAQPLETRFAF